MNKRIVVQSGFVVWVDADGVLVNFIEMFNKYISACHGMDIPVDYDPARWDYTELFGNSVNFRECFNSLPDDWALNLNLLDGAVEFTHALHNLGCRVILLTSLPLHMSVHRIKNMVGHGIYFDEIYFTSGQKKTEIAIPAASRLVCPDGSDVRNVVIDDMAENVRDFMESMPNLALGVTLGIGRNKETLDKIAADFPSPSVCDAAASDPAQMFARLIEWIQRNKAA
jgi:hypothetical protein